MYARVARFEGMDLSNIDEQVAEMRQRMAAAAAGDLPAGSADQIRTLMETITRFVQLVDRESGEAIAIAFCETEADARRADAALDEMSPDEGEGRRTSAEILEVVLDESF